LTLVSTESEQSPAKKQGIAVYFPNIIGQAIPGNSSNCAILVVARDDGTGGVPVLAMSSLLKRGVRILSQTGYVNEKFGDSTLLLVCDIAGVNTTLDDLVIQLRKLKHVASAQYISLKDQMFDGMLFPLVLMDSNRVVAISSSMFFEIQERLKTTSDKTILLEAGKQYGKDIVSKIKQKFEQGMVARHLDRTSAPELKVIQENVNRYMKAAGWGKLVWENGVSLERVFIQDPPTPSSKEMGGSATGNLFLHGLISGIAESLEGRRFAVVEDHYDAQRRVLTIGLTERGIAMQIEAQNKKKETLSPEENQTALKEVERIITSVEQMGAGKQAEKPERSAQPEEQKLEEKLVVSSDSGTKVHFTIKRKTPAPSTATISQSNTPAGSPTPPPAQAATSAEVAALKPQTPAAQVPAQEIVKSKMTFVQEAKPIHQEITKQAVMTPIPPSSVETKPEATTSAKDTEIEKPAQQPVFPTPEEKAPASKTGPEQNSADQKSDAPKYENIIQQNAPAPHTLTSKLASRSPAGFREPAPQVDTEPKTEPARTEPKPEEAAPEQESGDDDESSGSVSPVFPTSSSRGRKKPLTPRRDDIARDDFTSDSFGEEDFWN
jgi:hypothetical protein